MKYENVTLHAKFQHNEKRKKKHGLQMEWNRKVLYVALFCSSSFSEAGMYYLFNFMVLNVLF